MPSAAQQKLTPRGLAAIAAAAFSVIFPFFIIGQASGHDIAFHLSSWMDVARQWQMGVVFPHWAALANYGYGEPRFIFYPPISWCLGAALGLLLPWKMVPGAFIFFSLVLAGLSMHRLARGRMSPQAALAAAVIYAVNPYFLVIAYLRSDFAELLAAAIFPLAVHYLLECLATQPQQNPADPNPADPNPADPNPADPNPADKAHAGQNAPRYRQIAPLAVIYAAMWLTNDPAAVVATYALSLLLVMDFVSGGRNTFKQLHARTNMLVLGGAGLALGLALAAFYLVPAAFEQRWVNISQAVSAGLRYNESFLFTWILDPEHNLVNLEVSAIASLMIALIGIGAVVSHRRMRRAAEAAGTRAGLDRASKSIWAPLAFLGAASTFMMFPASAAFWRYAPKLRFVQFPWRWLFVLAVGFAYFWGEMAAASGTPRGAPWHSRLHRPAAQIATQIAIIVALAATGVTLATMAWWDTEDVPVMLAAVQSGSGYEGVDEYCTRGGDQYNLAREAPLVGLLPPDTLVPADAHALPVAGSITVLSWQPQRKVFTVEATQPLKVALRLMYYPAWKVRVNGSPGDAEADADSGQMIIPLRPGFSRVEVNFGWTADRAAGLALSLAAIIVLGIGGIGGLDRGKGRSARPDAHASRSPISVTLIR
jgi:hypothetical protein